MSKFNPLDPKNGYDEADLSQMKGNCAFLVAEASQSIPGLRLDAAENPGMFFAQQLAYVKNKAYDKIFPELNGLKLFPQTSDVDEGAAYLEYFSYEPTGIAKIISNYGDDQLRVDVKGKPHRAEIVSAGVAYGYTVAELRAARRNAIFRVGKPLDAQRAEAARRAYDTLVNHLIWNGDSKAGIIGVLSSGNNIPVVTLSAGASTKVTWADKTADEIAADISSVLQYINRTTKDVEKPDSIVLPSDLYTLLSLRRIDGTSTSVLTYLKENCEQLKNWESATELSSANTDYNNSGKNIALFYTKDAEKMSHEAPMPFKQYPVQNHNLEMVVNTEGRDAGMVIPYPLSAAIVYGI